MLNDKKRDNNVTQKNLEYLREFKECRRELGRIVIIAYLLITKFQIYDTRQIFYSARKQRRLCASVIGDLKEYGIDQKYHKAIQRDIKSIHNRAAYAFKMIQENIRMTEYYPYFMAVGFDKLMDWSTKYPEDNEMWAAQLIGEITEWNAEHPEEIAKHMESIAEEKANMERHRAKVKADAIAEKEARREAKKRETAYIKEMRENEKKYQQRKRKIEREFERYYR